MASTEDETQMPSAAPAEATSDAPAGLQVTQRIEVPMLAEGYIERMERLDRLDRLDALDRRDAEEAKRARLDRVVSRDALGAADARDGRGATVRPRGGAGRPR